MNTSELTNAILIAASENGARLFRNNSGRFKDKRGAWVSFGVGPMGGGGGDLIGWCNDGKFVSIEIKAGRDKPTDAQLTWIKWVNVGGGRAGIARSVEDALSILNEKPS